MTVLASYGLSQNWEIPCQVLTYCPAPSTSTTDSWGTWTVLLKSPRAILRIALSGDTVDVVAQIDLWQASGWTLLGTYSVPRPPLPLGRAEQRSHALSRTISYVTPLVAAITATADSTASISIPEEEARRVARKILVDQYMFPDPTAQEVEYAAAQVAADYDVALCVTGEKDFQDLPADRAEFARSCRAKGHYLQPAGSIQDQAATGSV